MARIILPDASFGHALRFFSADTLADATWLTGFYMMTARFLETLMVDLDDAPSDILLRP